MVLPQRPALCSCIKSACVCMGGERLKGDRKIGIKKKIRLNCFQNLVNCGRWQDCGQMNIFATGGLLKDPDAGQDVLRCLHINIGRHGALYLYLYCCVFALTSGDTVLCLRPHLFTGRDSQRPKMVRQFAQSMGSFFWRQILESQKTFIKSFYDV